MILAGDESQWLLVGVIVASLAFGVLFVLPIGGADMPVVISLLNACTGLAASAAGFALHENVLIVSGALVGASGTLLTLLMGRAMNRSITNVLFGAFGQIQSGTGTALDDGRSARATTAEDVAIMLVVRAPGGVRAGLRAGRRAGAARRPRARRSPRGEGRRRAVRDPPGRGAHAGPHERAARRGERALRQLFEMEEINPELPQTDVAVVIGANDVVNPAARTDPASPIYGMPIIDVDKATNVVVIKRSLAPGFAGIDNPLFYDARRRRCSSATRSRRSSSSLTAVKNT